MWAATLCTVAVLALELVHHHGYDALTSLGRAWASRSTVKCACLAQCDIQRGTLHQLCRAGCVEGAVHTRSRPWAEEYTLDKL